MISIGNIFKHTISFFSNCTKTSPYIILSLGPNCYPKTVLTRTGLMKRRKHGQKTYPFDLAWFHSAQFITDFLNNNFENFLTDLKYSERSGSWDNYGKINFSHESYVGPTEKGRLIEIYRRRIKNFRKIIQSDLPILFLQIFKNSKPGADCINLASTLKTIMGDKPFVYAVVDCINIIKEPLPEEIKLLKLNLPEENTDVFSPDFYNSETGKNFENTISEFIKQIIKDDFLTEPVLYL